MSTGSVQDHYGIGDGNAAVIRKRKIPAGKGLCPGQKLLAMAGILSLSSKLSSLRRMVEWASMSTTAPAEFSMQRSHTSDQTGPVKWVWSHARRHGWIIIMMVVGAIGNAGLAAVVPVLTGDAFNAMLKPKPDTSVLIPLALIIGITQIIRGVLQLGRNFGAELLAQNIERSVRDELYLSLLGKSMTFHNLQPVGDTMARATNDVREVNYMFSPGVNLVVGSFIFLLVPIFVAGRYHPTLVIVPIVYIFCLFCFPGSLSKNTLPGHRRSPRYVWGNEHTSLRIAGWCGSRQRRFAGKRGGGPFCAERSPGPRCVRDAGRSRGSLRGNAAARFRLRFGPVPCSSAFPQRTAECG